MSRHAALSSLFGDDPFFNQGELLWPLSKLRQDLFERKDQKTEGFFEGKSGLLDSALMPAAFLRMGERQEDEDKEDPPRASSPHDDLLVTLDARGYAPGDISVKLEGRNLLVMASKEAGAQDARSCSSATSRASFASSAASRVGFKQNIRLSPHLDLSGLSCSLMDDGQLRIHAPVARKQITQESSGEEEPREPKREELEEDAPPLFRTSLEFPVTKEKTEDTHRHKKLT
ncbi:heat shock protein beta-9 isoform X1 [Stigmatopora nigra]